MIHVINLPRDIEKKENITKQLESVKVPFMFHDGVKYEAGMGVIFFHHFAIVFAFLV